MLIEKHKIYIVSLLMIMFFFYSINLYIQLPSNTFTGNATSLKGKLLWQKYNCSACHQIYGLGGFLGPDLTNVYSMKGVAHIEAFLKNGSTVMPNFHLQKTEIILITYFLEEIDQSGSSDPRTFKIEKNGCISQE